MRKTWQLTDRLSRLAREELRHFEQVQKLMRELQVPFMRLSPSRYADGLRRACASRSRSACSTCCLCGALIEARSCERFEGSGAALFATAGRVLRGLAHRRRGIKRLYLRLAEQRADGEDWRRRLQ